MAFSAYQEAGAKIRDRVRARGFWPLRGAAKGKGKTKKGKGFKKGRQIVKALQKELLPLHVGCAAWRDTGKMSVQAVIVKVVLRPVWWPLMRAWWLQRSWRTFRQSTWPPGRHKPGVIGPFLGYHLNILLLMRNSFSWLSQGLGIKCMENDIKCCFDGLWKPALVLSGPRHKKLRVAKNLDHQVLGLPTQVPASPSSVKRVWVLFWHPSNLNIRSWSNGRVLKRCLDLGIMGPWKVWGQFMFRLVPNGFVWRWCKDGLHFSFQMPFWDFLGLTFWSANQFWECRCGSAMFGCVGTPKVWLLLLWKNWLKRCVTWKVSHALRKWSLGQAVAMWTKI